MEKRSEKELFEKGKEYAFFLLKFRPRSRQELFGRMIRKKFAPDTISKVIEFLEEKKFIDDADFALAWARGRLKNSIGPRRIKNELRLKGVDSEIIEEGLAGASEGYSEDEIVIRLIKNKLESLRDIEPAKKRQRIYAYLIRRGFAPDTAADNIKKLIKDES